MKILLRRPLAREDCAGGTFCLYVKKTDGGAIGLLRGV